MIEPGELLDEPKSRNVVPRLRRRTGFLGEWARKEAVLVFKGEVLSVKALLDASLAATNDDPVTRVVVHHPAAANAASCRTLLADGETLEGCWGFGVLQTMDDYTSVLRRGGSAIAAEVFDDEVPRTGRAELDTAFAALAEYLADRDGWQAPDWIFDPLRHTGAWYPAVPAFLHDDADRESPDAFRRRGILITSRSLARA